MSPGRKRYLANQQIREVLDAGFAPLAEEAGGEERSGIVTMDQVAEYLEALPIEEAETIMASPLLDEQLTEEFWDELSDNVGVALHPETAPAPVPAIEQVVVKDLEAWVKASSPLPRAELLTLRVNQERWYTLFTAQQVADGYRIVKDPQELSDLNRLGRSYFGRDFAALVKENLEMVAFNQESSDATHRSLLA